MGYLTERARRMPLLLAGVVALLVINTGLSATRYLALESAVRVPIDESPVWATAQLEVELARFVVTFDDFAGDAPTVTRDDMVEHFEVAWSRLNLFAAGINARWLDGRPAGRQALDRLQTAFQRLEPVITNARNRDPAAARLVRETLLPEIPVVKRLTTASLQEEVEERTRLISVQAELRSEIKVFAASALAAFLSLMIYLVRAEARTRASVRELSKARAEAEAASTRLSEAIANISEGFVLFDADDRLLLCNDKYREYYALSAHAIRPGETFGNMLRAGVEAGQYETAKADPDGFIADRLRRRGQLAEPFEQRLGDGRWLMISDRRTRDGGIVGVRTDITELKRRETELQEAQSTLQMQAEELRLLADGAQRANEAKSEFLATLSHEIRTPMNAVVGLSDLLTGATLDRQSEGYVAAINEAANQLLHLINTILDLSRLEAGRADLDTAPFDLEETLSRLTGVVRALAASKPVSVSCVLDPGLPAVVHGDQGRLYQVLLNLLANSVKFTREGSVTLQASTGRRGRDWIRFEVRDTGPGLPPNVVERLFEPFVRGAAAVEEREAGTGLGLAISRRFADLMEGLIGVAETSPAGTTFFVELRLPPGQRSDLARADQLPTPGLLRPLRVLVAEDTPSSRMVLQAMLDRLGHAVTSVENGREAVEAAASSDFDVVIMDMQMPVLDGLGATRAIRALQGPASRVPIVFLTAQALPEARREAAEAGTPYYLTKPTRRDDLERMLAEVVESGGTLQLADRGVDKGVDSAAENATRGSTVLEVELAALRHGEGGAIAELRAVLPAAALATVLDRFRIDAQDRTESLGRAALSGDAALVRREAHKLAGVLGQLGLVSLSARARAMQSMVDGEAFAAAPGLIADTGAAVAALDELITTVRDERAAAPALAS